MGARVKATKVDKMMVVTRDIPNSLNILPTSPGIKDIGRIVTTKTIVVAITAKPISLLPLIAAINGFSPISNLLMIFSNTTIESSTTNPMAKTKPKSVRVLSEKPSNDMTKKEETIAIGIVNAGISVALPEPTKKKITNNTTAIEINNAEVTSLIDSSINSE